MKNSKKGSSTVFLTLIMATIFSIVFMLIAGARSEYIDSRIDGAATLAGDSLMSEYDYYVQKEYGLFILGGTKAQLTSKLKSYINYGIADLKNVSLNSASVSGSGYSLADGQIIRRQIVEYMKYAEAEGVFKSIAKPARMINDLNNETLRNGPTIVSLPSQGMPDMSLTSLAVEIAKNPGGLTDSLKSGGENFLINRYIISHFNNRTFRVKDEHFFKSEAEYILGGKLSDEDNEKRVKMAIEALRFPLNLEHVLTDKVKMAKLLAAAEIMTPEAAPATQLILAGAWAYMETDNDIKLLWDGYKVPILKDESSWAVDLDSLLEGLEDGVFKPSVNKGHEYDDYLQMLLFFENNDLKIARVMDLIQINMRMNHDRTFVIGEHCTGLHIQVTGDGRNFSYEKKY